MRSASLVLTGFLIGCNSAPAKEECTAIETAIDSVKMPSMLWDEKEAASAVKDLSEGAARIEAVAVKHEKLRDAQVRYVRALRGASSKMKEQIAKQRREPEARQDAILIDTDSPRADIEQLCAAK